MNKKEKGKRVEVKRGALTSETDVMQKKQQEQEGEEEVGRGREREREEEQEKENKKEKLHYIFLL